MILQFTTPVQGGLRQERKLQMIANHLANVDTSGFKSDMVTFDQLLRSEMGIDFSPGPLKTTGNPLDLALEADGFFKVRTASGERYTRNGSFTLSPENLLVTANGSPVMGEGGEITIEGRDIQINRDGEITVDGVLVDKLAVVTFESPRGMTKDGDSLFVGPTDSPEISVETPGVRQGALEGSNVQAVTEMTRMVETMRTYEALQKMIQAYDETDGRIISEVGKD
jgi:flagellar basal-body rod protein FlgG